MQNTDREKAEFVFPLRRASLRRVKETARIPSFPAEPVLPRYLTGQIPPPAGAARLIRISLEEENARSACRPTSLKPSLSAKSINPYSAEPSEAHSSLFLSFFSSLATRHSPITAPFNMMQPIPIKTCEWIVHPCSVTECPTVTSSPSTSGY